MKLSRFWSPTVLMALIATLLLTAPKIYTAGLETTTYPFTFADDLGRKVTIPAAPKRIVSIGPSNTEILFAIGAGDLVVGVDSYSDYPPEAKRLKPVGDLQWPAFDKIVALEPDLVFVIHLAHENIGKLTSLGLKVAVIAPSNLNQICKTLQLMGQVVNRQSQAQQVVLSMQGRVKAVQDAVAKISKDQRLRVFYEIWSDPIRTAGPGSFLHDLIEIAGGINIAGDAKTPWPNFSLEALVERDPQVIFTSRQESLQELKSHQRKPWSKLTAVQTSRVYLLDENEIFRPGPRVVRGLEAMAKYLYPKQFVSVGDKPPRYKNK